MIQQRAVGGSSPSSSSMSSAASTMLQPAICNILHVLYEKEPCWPEIFARAYVDDSLGERSWVDNSLCKDFVQSVHAAFGTTKSIPFSVDTNSSKLREKEKKKRNKTHLLI
jgi:hypothetical protein